MVKLYTILLAVLAISCNNPIKNSNNEKETGQSAMKVEELENLKLYLLPDGLKEISGISFLSDDIVLAIQDEDGILYQYNLKEEKILKELKFGPPDDYEDLVLVGKDVYVVVSNGNVIQIKNYQSDKPEINKFKTSLTKKNDIEGLAYELKNNRLLLSAKAKGENKNEETRDIYSFDLSAMKLEEAPAYSIRLDEIEAHFKGDALVESSKKFLKALGNKNINDVLRPSAITIDPRTNQIFVLSSINNLIAVLTSDGKIKQVMQFEGKEHKQPEGMAFSENGKLYISNEAGKNGKGNIIELEYAN